MFNRESFEKGRDLPREEIVDTWLRDATWSAHFYVRPPVPLDDLRREQLSIGRRRSFSSSSCINSTLPVSCITHGPSTHSDWSYYPINTRSRLDDLRLSNTHVLGGAFIEPHLTNHATRPVCGGRATSSQVTQPCSRNQLSEAWKRPLRCCDHPRSIGNGSSRH